MESGMIWNHPHGVSFVVGPWSNMTSGWLITILWIAEWYRSGGRLAAEQVVDEVSRRVLQSVIQPE
jgi:hypothetical protein